MNTCRVLSALAALLLCPMVATAAPARPNILFFLVDDMGVTDTSVPFLQDAQGELIKTPLNQRYRTPHMQRLAEQGMRFTNAYAYTVCTPTRVSLISGLEAPRLRITTWTHPQRTIDTGQVNEGGVSGPQWRMQGLDPAQVTLPRILAGAGYRTIHCGKAHFGPNDTPSGDPTHLGFDVNIAGHGAGGIGSHLGRHNFSAKWRGGGRDWDVPGMQAYHGQDIFLTEALTREMKQAIASSVEAEQPFFAYMAHYAVHAPFEVDQRFAKNYPQLKGKALAFATMVEGMDRSLGDLVAHLETLGVAEDTLIVFYSDNGSDGPPNVPLRGIKGSRWMGGNRVPLIVAWGKTASQESDVRAPASGGSVQAVCPIAQGSREDDLVTPVDFLPTLARIAGVSLPAGFATDGHDLTPYLKGQSGVHRPQQLLVHFPHGRHRSHLFTSWTDGDWKITYEYAKTKWHLVNLREDIGEKQNLVRDHPKRALALARQMLQQLDQQQAQFPLDLQTGTAAVPDPALITASADKPSAVSP